MNRGYQLYSDYLKFGARSCYPPISHGDKALTPPRRTLEIMKNFLYEGPFGNYCKTHYRILKEEGLKKYLFYSYKYRSKQLKNIFSKHRQSSTGMPMGECVPERIEGFPAEPVKRSLHSAEVPRACPWVSMKNLQKNEGAPPSHRFHKRMSIISEQGINLVIDVEANTGLYAKPLWDSGYKGKILSFEPLNSAYEELLRNARNNPLWLTFPLLSAIATRTTKLIFRQIPTAVPSLICYRHIWNRHGIPNT